MILKQETPVGFCNRSGNICRIFTGKKYNVHELYRNIARINDLTSDTLSKSSANDKNICQENYYSLAYARLPKFVIYGKSCA